jgi:hypothetical protein
MVPLLESSHPLAPSRGRRRNWAVTGLIGLAQAAAVLLAVGLAWHVSNGRKSTEIVQTGQANSPILPHQRDRVAIGSAIPTVEVEEGRLFVIVIPAAGEKATVVDRTPERMYLGVDDWYLVYNAVEALANPLVAMKE